MHIGLLIYGSLATISGGYLYDRQLVACLQTAGHRVEIVSLPWRNYGRHLTDNVSPTLWTRLRQASFDLLLQDELNHPSLAWLNPRLRAVVRYPLVSIVHHLRSSETHPRRWMPLYHWVERRYLHSVDGLLYNSHTTCAIVQTLLATSKPYRIAYPAADHRQSPSTAAVLRLIEERCQEPGPRQLLFVGNVIARKGLHTLLHALAVVPRAQWHLHVVGSLTTDPAYVAHIKRLAADRGLTAQVTLHGTASDAQINDLYHCCHLYAAPAFEGFGISYLEAMSFGLPVLAATTGAAQEIVAHGVNGFLVEPTDHATLASYITRLCTQPVQLCEMGRAARHRYDRHPTWQTSFAPVLPWLAQIAQGSYR